MKEDFKQAVHKGKEDVYIIYPESSKSIVVPDDKFTNYRWFNFPFGTTPCADREMYEKLASEAAKVQISVT